MAKKLHLPSLQEFKRNEAKDLLKARVPIRKIPKQARVSLKTVQRLRKKGTQRKKGSGRKHILDRSQKLSIRNLWGIILS